MSRPAAPYLQQAPSTSIEDLQPGEPLRDGERLNHPQLGLVIVSHHPCPRCAQAGVTTAGTLKTMSGRTWCPIHNWKIEVKDGQEAAKRWSSGGGGPEADR